MKKVYVMVRVSKETHQALIATRQRLQNSQEKKGRNPLPETEGFGVTLDTTIAELVKRDHQHNLRGKRKPIK